MYPELIPFLYSERTVPDVIQKYAATLEKSSNPIEQYRAKCLLEYLSIRSDKNFLKEFQVLFLEIRNAINLNYPYVEFQFLGRIKSLFSVVSKMEKLEKLALDSGLVNQDPFDRIHDFFAFRIILEDMSPAELIVELYKTANYIIEYFTNRGFTIIPHNLPIDTGYVPNAIDPSIYVPSCSFLNNEYVPFVKDYVINPKKSGYQSLHIVFREPLYGRLFEVQLRTSSMEQIATTIANHRKYKDQKYGDLLSNSIVDPSKIFMRGFKFSRYYADGLWSRDCIGLYEPIDIMHIML